MQTGVLLAAGVGKFWLDVHWKDNVKNTGEDWGWRAGGGWGLFHWGPVDTDCVTNFYSEGVWVFSLFFPFKCQTKIRAKLRPQTYYMLKIGFIPSFEKLALYLDFLGNKLAFLLCMPEMFMTII